jgi:hypothetical protein
MYFLRRPVVLTLGPHLGSLHRYSLLNTTFVGAINLEKRSGNGNDSRTHLVCTPFGACDVLKMLYVSQMYLCIFSFLL